MTQEISVHQMQTDCVDGWPHSAPCTRTVYSAILCAFLESCPVVIHCHLIPLSFLLRFTEDTMFLHPFCLSYGLETGCVGANSNRYYHSEKSMTRFLEICYDKQILFGMNNSSVLCCHSWNKCMAAFQCSVVAVKIHCWCACLKARLISLY